MATNNPAVAEACVAELRRCKALEEGNFEALSSLLHPQLVYVHSNGAIDSRESYLARCSAAGVRFIRSERRDLVAWASGETVIMSGEIVTVMQRSVSTPPVEVSAFLTQVYARVAGVWLMAQLHASKDVTDERNL